MIYSLQYTKLKFVLFICVNQEWIETMWDCMRVNEMWTCIPFFMATMMIGNLVVCSYMPKSSAVYSYSTLSYTCRAFNNYLPTMSRELIAAKIYCRSARVLQILKLFLALLLSSFSGQGLDSKDDEEPNKIAEAIDRIERFMK